LTYGTAGVDGASDCLKPFNASLSFLLRQALVLPGKHRSKIFHAIRHETMLAQKPLKEIDAYTKLGANLENPEGVRLHGRLHHGCKMLNVKSLCKRQKPF
jgi:hypothetical protein